MAAMARRRFLAPAAAAAAGLLLQFLPVPTAVVDRLYVAGWFPHWERLAAALGDASQRSLSCLAFGVCLTLAVLYAAWALVAPSRAVAPGAVGRPRWRAPRTALAWLLALLVFWFPLGFGLAYRASSLSHAVGEPPLPDAAALEAWLVAALNRAASDLDAAEAAAPGLTATYLTAAEPHGSGPSVPEPAAAERASPQPMAAAATCVAETALAVRARWLPSTLPAAPVAPALPHRVKATPAGALLRLGYAGVVVPWLLEPHVDAGLPPPAALAVGLHELAHVAGFAQEAEAEAVAVLAGLTCADPRVRYAAALNMASSLRAGMPADAAGAFVAAWPLRALGDASAASEAAARYRVAFLQRGANAVYGAYLRAQGGAEGLREYGRGTRLGLVLLLQSGVLRGDGAGGEG